MLTESDDIISKSFLLFYPTAETFCWLTNSMSCYPHLYVHLQAESGGICQQIFILASTGCQFSALFKPSTS